MLPWYAVLDWESQKDSSLPQPLERRKLGLFRSSADHTITELSSDYDEQGVSKKTIIAGGSDIVLAKNSPLHFRNTLTATSPPFV